MAHNRQFRESVDGVLVKRYDFPKKGELYWNRVTHRVVEADKDLQEKFLIVERRMDETLH